jgi:hypothetical protein
MSLEGLNPMASARSSRGRLRQRLGSRAGSTACRYEAGVVRRMITALIAMLACLALAMWPAHSAPKRAAGTVNPLDPQGWWTPPPPSASQLDFREGMRARDRQLLQFPNGPIPTPRPDPRDPQGWWKPPRPRRAADAARARRRGDRMM